MIINPTFPVRPRMLQDNFQPAFSFDKELVLRAYDFGRQHADSSKDAYARRGQRNLNNIIEQSQTSKIVEEMNHTQLLPYFPQLSKPDWNIYLAKDKNWDPDLTDKTTDPITKIGIKSQRSEIGKTYGVSWVFEFRAGRNYDTDKGVFGEEAKKPGHYICFNSIDVLGKTGKLHAIVAVSTLHQLNLFEAMKKQNLQGNKLAVYLESLNKKMAA